MIRPEPTPGRRPLRFLSVLLATASLAFGQSQNVITTIAGTDWLFPADGKPALNAPLGGKLWMGVTLDKQGNYYIADPGNLMVMKVTPDGVVHVIAGNGVLGYSGDGGRATDAALGTPLAVVVDSGGNVYFADLSDRVRRVDPSGIITTVAGTGDTGFSGDGGPATDATFDGIMALAIDSADNIYVVDQNNHRIRRFTPGGSITTIAGTGQAGYSGDGGPARSAQLNTPYGVAVDRAGNVFFTDLTPIVPELGFSLGLVRMITAAGVIGTIDGPVITDVDGSPSTRVPIGIAVDTAGNVYIGDAARSSVFQISVYGTTLIAGRGRFGDTGGFSGDGGPATAARLKFNFGGIAVDSANNVYIGDNGNFRVRKVSGGKIATVAGNGQYRYSGEGVAATSATLYLPNSVALDGLGNIYVAEPWLDRVRKITANGVITTYAGNGDSDFTGDNGPARQAALDGPYAVAADAQGNLYIADAYNSRIRKVSPSGIITTIAGTGDYGYSGDGGPAISAVLNSPQGIAVDAAGNVYISDTDNHRIRKITTDGKIQLVAGSGRASFADGPAASSSFNAPQGLKVDLQGNVYVADWGNHRVRKIANGAVTTVAGNGRASFSGDGGLATAAALYNPSGVAIDPAGNLYIADSGNYRLRVVSVSGTIATVSGNDNPVSAGDGGPAGAATFAVPLDVAIDAKGSLLVIDQFGHRVRAILSTPPDFQAAPVSLSFSVVPGGPVTAARNLYLSGTVPGIPFTLAADHDWLTVSPSSGFMPATIQVTVDPSRLDTDQKAAITATAALTASGSKKVAVTLDIGAGAGAGLSLESDPLSFSLFTTSAPSSQTVALVSTGADPNDFAASADSATPWLSVTPASGTVAPRGRVFLTVTVDPAGLKVGTYTGRLVVKNLSDGTVSSLTVTATLTAAPQSILLPENGLTFTAVAGGGVTPPQNVSVLNLGLGNMNWRAQAAYATAGRSGTPPWLTVTPGSGTSGEARSTAPQFTVAANASGLAPGNYYGQIQVIAPDADNSPQSVLVVLTVLPANSTPAPFPQPTAVIYYAAPGINSPSSQVVTLTNLTGRNFYFSTGRLTQSGKLWFTLLPAAGVVPAGGSARIVVQPLVNGLDTGVYRGALTVQFDNGEARTISVNFIVASQARTLRNGARAGTAGCIPTKLVPIFTSIGSESAAPAGWPQRLVVRVLDDCGGPMVSGKVTAVFSAAVAPLTLSSLLDGNWSATWHAGAGAPSSIGIKVQAEIADRTLQGAAEITGTLAANTDPPEVDDHAIVNTASFTPDAPLAPGTLVRFSGRRLASATAAASGFPLPTQLADSQVVIGGSVVPLMEVADDHVTALIPYQLAVNTRLQAIVMRGDSVAVPEQLTIAPAQPGVFTQNKQGSGQGLVYKVASSGGMTLADSNAPATAGDTVVLMCTGLGAVAPQLDASAAPPDPPAAVMAPVTVSIGGADAPVSAAALQPGSAGVYAVTVTVPQGASAGDSVAVMVTAAGRVSPPVTMAIR